MVSDTMLGARLAKEFGESLRGELRAFARVPSTMDAAHALAAQGAAEGTLVWAQRQEQGRGRQGRAWESPEGGAYFSIIVKPSRPAAEIPQLSLIAGLAAAEAVRECAMLSPRVRWPNDLLLNGKKLAGILTEAKNGAVVIGVGINVTTKPSDLPDTAISLTAAGGKDLDPFLLTARLYRRFFRWYDVWGTDGLASVREALRPQMALFGEVVRITTNQTSDISPPRRSSEVGRGHQTSANSLEGQALDIDEQGRLVVRLDSGLMRAFEMGEVILLQ